MDKAIIEKIYTAIATALISFAAGFALKKIWAKATGSEPPDPEDPDVPTKQAVGWFLVSGVGLGAIQLLISRTIHRRVRTMGLDQLRDRQNS